MSEVRKMKMSMKVGEGESEEGEGQGEAEGNNINNILIYTELYIKQMISKCLQCIKE